MKPGFWLRPILSVTIFLAPFAGATGKDGEDSACIIPLGVARDLPPNWSFSPGEFARMAAAHPDLDFQWLVNLARFLDSPGNLPFFDLLGAYVEVGYAADGLWDGLRMDEVDHRPVQVHSIMEMAAARGILPARLNEDQIRFLGERLGFLPFQNLIKREETKNVSFDDVNEWFRRKRLEPPKLMSIVRHSRIAQGSFIHDSIRTSHAAVNYDAAFEAFELRLRGERGAESPEVELFLNQTFKTLDLTTQPPRGGKAKAGAWNVLHDSAKKIALMLFRDLLNMGLVILDQSKDGPHEHAMYNPIVAAASFEHALNDYAFIDQGLSPLLRRGFVELVLNRATLTGPQVRQRARADLDQVMRKMRGAWRAMEKEAVRPPVTASTTAVGESREERLRAYREMVLAARDEVANAPAGYGKIVKVIADDDPADKPAKHTLIDPGPWPRLLDENQSIADVRRLLPELIVADNVLELDLRSGFRYRVEFGKDLIKQLTDPEAGEPADPREWLTALQSGPARATGQNGWKKRSVPVQGLYDWEIKLTSSPYRMLGFKKADGVWRFEVIKLMH